MATDRTKPWGGGPAACRALAALLLGACALSGAGLHAEPAEEWLGKARGYPLGDGWTFFSNPYRVGSWSALDKVPGIRTRLVPRGAEPGPLPRAGQPPAVHYSYQNNSYTLHDYLERQRATGLLLLKNGEIVAEHYRYGRRDDARFLSMSMAKSVTSLLIGQALERGLIASLDDSAEKYAKALAGSPCGATTLRQLLRMSSGLTFTERYDGKDDVARLARANGGVLFAGTALAVLRSITARHAPAGEKFVYASAETEVLGRVLTGATGRSLADLTSEWLWQPMGAEHDAFWRVSADGQEQASAAFNASLRDWARLGLLLAKDGQVSTPGGMVPLVPREYLLDATDPARQPQAFKPRVATSGFGYGYQFWLVPLRERTFAMQGVHGQAVYVQPASGIVMVLTSVWEGASGRQDPQPFQEHAALWRGVLQSLGGSLAE